MSDGVFITFEGIDGSGKSTQLRKLAEALSDRDPVITREPGGAPGAEEIRGLLLSGDADKWSAETELLLFTAARRDHVEKTIQPALDQGRVVLCDRFADSTRVYQGATRGDLRGKVDQLHDLMIGLSPDLTFIIDMSPEIALARGLARGTGEDRFEEMGLSFQETLRHGFLTLARDNPDRCVVINGDRPLEDVAAEVLAHTLQRLAT